MSGKAFFDTTVLIYAVSDDPRASSAEKLLADGGVVSVQGLNEFVAVARRKLKLSWKAVADTLQDLRALCAAPVAITLDTHDAALRIAQRYGFNIYDSLMIASAIEAGCTTLYSEDMQDGQTIGPVTIRNPFLYSTAHRR